MLRGRDRIAGPPALSILNDYRNDLQQAQWELEQQTSDGRTPSPSSPFEGGEDFCDAAFPVLRAESTRQA
jgi:hypothetical protein